METSETADNVSQSFVLNDVSRLTRRDGIEGI
jgi:hypothetical protein